MAEAEPPPSPNALPPPPSTQPPETENGFLDYSKEEDAIVDRALIEEPVSDAKAQLLPSATTPPAATPPATTPPAATRMHISDVVLQVKPRLLGISVSTTDVGDDRKGRAGKFGARLRKIRETRIKPKDDKATLTDTKLHHSVSSPDVLTSESVVTTNNVLEEIKELPCDNNIDFESNQTVINDVDNDNPDFSDQSLLTKGTVHLYESIDELPMQNKSQFVHVYDLPDNDTHDDHLPPLPSSPPPPFPPQTESSLPFLPPQTESSPLPSTRIPSDHPLTDAVSLVLSSNNFLENPSLPPSDSVSYDFLDNLPDNISDDAMDCPLPSEGPPLLLDNNSPILLTNSGPPSTDTVAIPPIALPTDNVTVTIPTITPPTDTVAITTIALPTDTVSKMNPELSKTIKQSDRQILHVTTQQQPSSKNSPEEFTNSPNLTPGYVQFSTEGSGTTLGCTDSNGANSLSSDMGSHVELRRPLSVTSMGTSLEIPFQSNLKKWKVTNLTEMEDLFETRSSSSLPSSGRMRRIHSNVEPMMHSLSLSSQMNGGVVNHSLESITENHTPPDTPPTSPSTPINPPLLIQERLTSGTLFNKDVTVTRVAKTRWSLIEDDSKPDGKEKELVSNGGGIQRVNNNESLQDTTKNRHGDVKIKKIKKQSINERKDEHDLYDIEGDPHDGEGNLHKINRDIPKSMSSFFESVVSDIPGLASTSSSEEEDNDGIEWKYKDDTRNDNNDIISRSLNSEHEKTQKTRPPLLGPPLLSTLQTVKQSNSAELLGADKKEKASFTKDTMKESLSYDNKMADHNNNNSVHKRFTGKRSESLVPVKIFMQRIHPGLLYKMFLISSSTSAREVVVQGLEKANIIDDPKCFALYEVYDISQEAIRVLQEQEYPLSSRGNSSAPTHLELRKCRVHEARSIKISTDSIPHIKHKFISLTISVLTTVREVVTLTLRKLQLYNENDQKRNRYKIMIIDTNAGEEWLLDDDRCLLDEIKDSYNIVMVDIEIYLHKGDDEKRFIEQTYPNDPHIMKALLHESKQQIVDLNNDLLVKDRMLNQLRVKIDSTDRINLEFQLMKESFQPLTIQYKDLQESSSKEIQELRTSLAAIEREMAERLSIESKQVLTEIEIKDKSISEMKIKIIELEEIIRTRTELQRIIDDKNMEITVLNEGITRQDDIISDQEVQIDKMETILKDKSLTNHTPERNILLLEDKIADLEKENQLLKDSTKPETDIGTNDSYMNLFTILGSVIKQIVLSIEIIPTDEEVGDLGVQLSNNIDGIGSIVKTIAETSSAKGILQSGDRLLEVNGTIVKTHSHKDIVSILQAHSGPVQMVVSRSVSEDSNGEIEVKTKKIINDLEEKLVQQLSLNDHWKQDNERLTSELTASFITVSTLQSQLKQLQEKCESLSKQCPLKDIHSLREHLASIQTDDEHSLADTLQDGEKEEILEVLRTVESDCLKHKQSSEQLLELIVSHNPGLLDIIADGTINSGEDETEDALGWC